MSQVNFIGHHAYESVNEARQAGRPFGTELYHVFVVWAFMSCMNCANMQRLLLVGSAYRKALDYAEGSLSSPCSYRVYTVLMAIKYSLTSRWFCGSVIDRVKSSGRFNTHKLCEPLLLLALWKRDPSPNTTSSPYSSSSLHGLYLDRILWRMPTLYSTKTLDSVDVC